MRKAYSKYKESGVYWIGDIPDHWDVWKIGHAFKYISSGTTPPAGESDWYDGDIPWITTTELRENVITEASRSVTKEALSAFSALKIHPKGSFVVAMYGATIGRVALLDIAATTNQACCVLSNSDIYSTELLFFLFQAFRKEIVALGSGGGQPNISQAKVASLKIPIPPIHEQKNIYNYLRVKLNEIDTLISKKEKFIERLKEKRTALISQVVTKGLPPEEAKKHGLPVNPKMKLSGVDWLGDIPAHWNVVPLKYLVSIQNGRDHKEVESNDGYPVYGSGGPFTYASEFLYDGEAVLFGRKGTIDRPLYVKGRFWTVDTMYWSKILNGVSGRFVYYAATTIPFRLYSTNTAVPSMTQEDLKGHSFAVPNYKEQRTIAEYLDGETSKIDKLVRKVELAIDVLQEYRSALITSAVTGKIDVRETVK